MPHGIPPLGPWSFYLAYSFLWLALLVAAVETGLMLWAKLQVLRKGPSMAMPADAQKLAANGIDPVQLLTALKALLETLKGLPVWVTIFLAGFLLLSVAGLVPKT